MFGRLGGFGGSVRNAGRVSDRGVLNAGPMQGRDLIFLSHSPEEHHQIVLIPSDVTDQGGGIGHVAFRGDSLDEVRRVYEKVRQEVERHATFGFKKKVLNWAMHLGEQHKDEIMQGKKPTGMAWKLADRLVYKRLRNALGGNGRVYYSGGAPLGHDMAEWFCCMGIPICEGYGLTETSPVISVNRPGGFKIGSVGKPYPNLQVKIAEDGEILVQGPTVFKGYWNMPEETKAAFTDGWFKTGDIGQIDDEGFLSITDRKKDLIKTSGGKFIAPQPIENALKTNVLIAQAAVIGDKRKYASVIIAPHFELLTCEWSHLQFQRGTGTPFQSARTLPGHCGRPEQKAGAV